MNATALRQISACAEQRPGTLAEFTLVSRKGLPMKERSTSAENAINILQDAFEADSPGMDREELAEEVTFLRQQIQDLGKDLEDCLRRSEKLEALGKLAGGVAHDLNNVLGILSGYSELLMEALPEASRVRNYADKILSASLKGAAIIQDMLILARRNVPVPKVIDLNRMVKTVLDSRELKKLRHNRPSITFRLEIAEALFTIQGSPLHLEKTIFNLLSNALEAIGGDAGVVTVRTEYRYLDRPVRGYAEVREGTYAVLTIADTGEGMSPEDIAKIFEPFHTRKCMGRSGTGLGLAIVWRTVADHDGYIEVRSDRETGTSFALYFPVTGELIANDTETAPIEQYRGRGESILVEYRQAWLPGRRKYFMMLPAG